MKRETHITDSAEATKRLGEKIAKAILSSPKNRKAVVIGLQGNLGGGKTTFLQGFAKGLGIKEKILSPTFVIQKRFELHPVKSRKAGILPKAKLFNRVKNKKLKNFFHVDCYRIKNQKEILGLNFKEIIKNPENIVAIEWPENIKKFLPEEIIFIKFKLIDKNKREIIFKI